MNLSGKDVSVGNESFRYSLKAAIINFFPESLHCSWLLQREIATKFNIITDFKFWTDEPNLFLVQ